MDQDLLAYLEQRFASLDRRFDEVDRRFDEVDKRFEQVDQRFEQVDKRFEQVDQRFENLETEVRGAWVSIEDLRGQIKLVAGNHKIDCLAFGITRRSYLRLIIVTAVSRQLI